MPSASVPAFYVGKAVDDNGDVRLIVDEFGANKEWFFDGKIGLYPLTEYRETKAEVKVS